MTNNKRCLCGVHGARIEEEIKDSHAEYDRNENRVDELIDVRRISWMDGAPNDASGE